MIAAWILLVAMVAPIPASNAETPAAAADRLLVEGLESLEPDSIGTDRHGHLWGWSRSRSEVVLFDDQGQARRSWQVADAGAVDVDHEWGLVILDSQGRRVLFPGSDRPPIDLATEAVSVEWLTGRQVVIGIPRGAHRVEVLDVDSGEVVRRLDEVGPMPPEPGARPSRSTRVEHDPSTGRMFLLDGFRGELTVLGPDGRRLHHLALRDDERPRFDAWLEEMDVQARRTGEIRRPVFWRFDFDLDPEGTAWLVESCSPGKAQVVRLAPDGEVRRFTIDTPCCSRRGIAVWNEQLVLHSPARSGQASCTTTRRLP